MRNLFSQDKWKYLSITLIGILATSMLSVAFQLPQLVQDTIGLQPAYGAGALANVFVMPSDNMFKSESYYVVAFTTGTTGTIKTITMTFPSGFVLTNAKLIEVQNIGAGSIGISGQTITYSVNSAVSMSAGTAIKIMIGKIVNAATTSNTVAVTTKNATPATIDGPTNSATFTLIQVTNSMIGTSAVSNSKIQSGAVTSAKIGSGVQLTGNVCLDSPTICVDSVNDRVGIGTTTPQGKLSIMDGDVLIGTIPYLPYVDSHSLWLTNDNGDPNNSFRIDPANNALYIIGDSAPGATSGASIVFRTGQAGNGENDVASIDPDGSLSVDSSNFKVDAVNHRVGIGTSTPQGKLDVVGGDLLIGNVPNRALPNSNSLYLTNDGGDPHNSFRIDALQNSMIFAGNSAPGATRGTNIQFRTQEPGLGESTQLNIIPGEVDVTHLFIMQGGTSHGTFRAEGNFFFPFPSTGDVILVSPDGTCHALQVDNAGVVTSASKTCPP